MKLLQIFTIDFCTKIWYIINQVYKALLPEPSQLQLNNLTPNHQLQPINTAELCVRISLRLKTSDKKRIECKK